ncbi:hypothetical protein [Paraburkholderia caffeinilytica]
MPSINGAALARIDSVHSSTNAQRQPNAVAKRIEASPALWEKL